MNDNSESQRLVFVVQKHKATMLHYDFRLEIGGVMPSWSIPKGPSLDNSVKRLAMPTEDHSLEYRHFEGVISEEVMRKGLEKGNLKFRLYGKKLHGSFALIRTRGFGGKVSWLLIKHHDEYVQQGYDAKDYDYSAVSNRSLAEPAWPPLNFNQSISRLVTGSLYPAT